MSRWFFILVLGLSATSHAWAELDIGSTRDEVVQLLGEPDLEITRRGRQVLYYAGEEIELAHNVVVGMDVDVMDLAQKVARDRLRPKPKPAPVFQPSPPLTTSAKEPVHIVLPNASKADTTNIKVISDKGARIELSELLVADKVTIVDFYADWCGPCRRIAPALEMLANDASVVLRKVDIVNWRTPVAKQFALRRIPNIRVFDRNGNMVGTPTSDIRQIRSWVEKSK